MYYFYFLSKLKIIFPFFVQCVIKGCFIVFFKYIYFDISLLNKYVHCKFSKGYPVVTKIKRALNTWLLILVLISFKENVEKIDNFLTIIISNVTSSLLNRDNINFTTIERHLLSIVSPHDMQILPQRFRVVSGRSVFLFPETLSWLQGNFPIVNRSPRRYPWWRESQPKCSFYRNTNFLGRTLYTKKFTVG